VRASIPRAETAVHRLVSWLLGWAIACSCAIARPVSAQPALRLSWQAPDRCPSADWVVARVARYLGRPVTLGEAAPLGAEVRIEVLPSGDVQARLGLASADGKRERILRDRDCVLVADAAAFIVAVAIDPAVRASDAPLTAEERQRGRRGETMEAESESESGSGSESESESESGSGSESESESGSGSGAGSGAESGSGSEVEPQPPPGPPLQIGWAFGLQGSLAWQPLPGLAPGVLVLAAARLGPVVRLELTLGYAPAQRHALPADGTVEVRLDHAAAALGGCALASTASTELGACLRIQAGVVRGQGDQLSAGHDGALLHLASSLGPLLIQRLSERLALRFELAPSLALVRPRFELDTGALVYQSEIVGFLAALGAELRFD